MYFVTGRLMDEQIIDKIFCIEFICLLSVLMQLYEILSAWKMKRQHNALGLGLQYF